MRSLVALALVCLVVGPARGQAGDPGRKNKQAKPRQEELKDLVARRIHQATGVEVRIGDLVYNLFNSTFTGKAIAVGPRGRPVLKVPRVTIKVELLSSRADKTVARLVVEKPRAVISAALAARPFRRANHRTLRVRSALVRDGSLGLRFQGGARVDLSGITLSLGGLWVPRWSVGSPPAMRGKVKIRVARVTGAGLHLRDVSMEGRLAGGALKVTRMSARTPGGSVTLVGVIGLGQRGGLGPFDLAGPVRFQLPSGATLAGKIRLRGKTAARLVLEGSLAGGKLKPRGGVKGAPPLRLKLNIGRRRLRGTLTRWRLGR